MTLVEAIKAFDAINWQDKERAETVFAFHLFTLGKSPEQALHSAECHVAQNVEVA